MIGLKIEGYIMNDGKDSDLEVFHSEFMELFLPFLESHGLSFVGITNAEKLDEEE